MFEGWTALERSEREQERKLGGKLEGDKARQILIPCPVGSNDYQWCRRGGRVALHTASAIQFVEWRISQ